MRVNPNYTANMVSLLNQSQQDETNALQALSTGRRVNKPSDDAAAEAAMVSENSRLAADDQYTANSESLKQILNTADSTLSSVVTILQRASTLAIEGANGTMNQTNLSSIAAEVSGINRQMLSLANTSYAGKYIFAGTATGSAPYIADVSVPGKIDYAGNDRQNSVQIGTGLTVSANLPGSSIFSQTSGNVFDALQSLFTALQSGDATAIEAAGTRISSAIDAINTSRVFYGNTVNELTSNETYLSQDKINIADYQNTLVSSDPAEATTAVTQAEYARNATVAAAAKMNQVSLLDYLK
ncbi:MAG TPA: flagellar hook-associated protein FlgL [Candidatus Saccharimonadales bacterium]|nr:flagellar hook-associated protein FlgL [Candidatus Saccharimonadales bacterium]